MTSESTPIIGAIEAGGTKFVCAVLRGQTQIIDETSIPTTDPVETLKSVIRFFVGARAKHGPVAAFGVGSFGPLDLDPNSQTHGFITTTPKHGWQHVDLIKPLKTQFKVPVAIDTDVNAAALGEYLWGAGKGCDPLIYITVGTGVGGGVIVNGHLLHGMMHPEIGHLIIPPPPGQGAINAACQCPFHESCLEGFASGPAIMKRWGMRAESLPADHAAWADVGDALASGLANLTLTLSPMRIILGGGVMHQKHLLPLIRAKFQQKLNGYLQLPAITRKVDDFIVSPGLGDRSGLLGAMALGEGALRNGAASA